MEHTKFQFRNSEVLYSLAEFLSQLKGVPGIILNTLLKVNVVMRV